jgi:hypothetical protein
VYKEGGPSEVLAHMNKKHRLGVMPKKYVDLMPHQCQHGCGHRFLFTMPKAKIDAHCVVCPMAPANFDPQVAEDGPPVTATEAHEQDCARRAEVCLPFENVSSERVQFWDGKLVDLHRDLAHHWRRHKEVLAKDMLEMSGVSAKVLATKANEMCARLVWRASGKGEYSMSVLRRRIKDWDEGNVVTLMVDLEAHDACRVLTEAAEPGFKKNAVLSLKNRLSSCYEFTRKTPYNKACEVMHGTPKWDGDVDLELKPLYPVRREILRDESENKPLPTLSKWNFSKAISKQQEGATASPSGNKMDHYRQADLSPVDDEEAPLEKRDPWHYSRQLCARLASGQFDWGEKSEEMYDVCFAVTLTVLQKDPIKKKPRPIGSGSSPTLT